MRKMTSVPTLVAWGEGYMNDQAGNNNVEWVVESKYSYLTGHYTGAVVKLPENHKYVLKIVLLDDTAYANNFYFDTYGIREMMEESGNTNEIQIYNQNVWVDAAEQSFWLQIFCNKDGFCRFEMTYPSVDRYLAYIYKLD